MAKRERLARNLRKPLFCMVLKARPTGLEPATPGSTVRYSNQLSYGPKVLFGKLGY